MEKRHSSTHTFSHKDEIKIGVMVLAGIAIIIMATAYLTPKESAGEAEMTQDVINADAELLAQENGMDPEEVKEMAGQASKFFSMSRIQYLGCKDSDGGKNQWTAGKVMVTYIGKAGKSTAYYADNCTDKRTLKEYYCSGRKHAYSKLTCRYGCLDNVCLRTAPTSPSRPEQEAEPEPDSQTCTPETCNGKDDDCDGQVDEGVTTTYYKDNDADGYGNPAATIQACTLPAGYIMNNKDCNDSRSDMHPGAKDLCDGLDNDCDPNTQDGSQETWLEQDCDGTDTDLCMEGTYNCTAGVKTCTDFTGDKVEVCDGMDNDCDGQVDEGVKITYYRDNDGDGYGNPSSYTQACTAPAGYILDKSDCNDANSQIHPGAVEVCNGINDDCNTTTPDCGGEESPIY